MTTSTNHTTTESIITANKKSVDRNIRTLVAEMEHENTLVAETPAGRFQKVMKIYRGIKPLLTVLGSLPLIPSTWRTAIMLFDQSLDSLSDVAGDITTAFKAGKDL